MKVCNNRRWEFYIVCLCVCVSKSLFVHLAVHLFVYCLCIAYVCVFASSVTFSECLREQGQNRHPKKNMLCIAPHCAHVKMLRKTWG